MENNYVKLTTAQLGEQMGMTADQMKSFSDYIQSDEFKTLSAIQMQEKMSRQFEMPKPLEVIPYAKLQLEVQEESLRTLRAIEQNTANLFTIVDLVNKNNEQQEELASLVNEIMLLAKAKSEAEARDWYGKTVKKISDTVKDSENLAKLIMYTTTVFDMVCQLLKK